MNHLYHTLNNFILLASFLVFLLAFLAPVPILADRVSLLSVSTNVTTTASSATTKRWIAEDALSATFHQKRMVKRAKKNSTSSAAATTSIEEVKLVLGPLGICYTNSTTAHPVCTSPSFTPIFVELYDNLTLPADVKSALPDQFPLAPTALFLSLLLLAFELLAVLFSSLSQHATKRAAFLGKRQPGLRKAATVAGMASLAVGLAAAIALRVQLAEVVDNLKKAGATGNLGSGFTQIFAGLALEAVALLLLFAEAFTNSPR